jgi:rod shape-determining protein MreD
VKTTIWQRLDLWARRLVPAGLSLLLVLVTALPLPVPGYSTIVPMLVLAAVFFWAVHRPRLLPLSVVFAIGLVQDAVTGAPLGAGTVVLLLAYGAVRSQRRFFHNKSFLQVWWGFMMVALAASLLSWLLACFLAGTLVAAQAAVFQYILTLAVYPIASLLFHGAERVLPSEA